MDVLAGAAGALLANRRAVIVELQGDPHDVIASAGQQGRGDCRINPSRHGRDHARAGRQGDRGADVIEDVGFSQHGDLSVSKGAGF